MRLPVRYERIGEYPVEFAENFVSLIEEADWGVLDYRKAMVAATSQTAYDSMVFRHSKSYSSDAIEDFPLRIKYEAALAPFIGWCRQHYQVKEWVALAARLRPGEQVKPHCDSGEFLERIHRLHFPLQTNEQAVYGVEEELKHMPVGTCYEIDNQRLHYVVNGGSTDRIHLIVNIYGQRIITSE